MSDSICYFLDNKGLHGVCGSGEVFDVTAFPGRVYPICNEDTVADLFMRHLAGDEYLDYPGYMRPISGEWC